MLKVIVFSPIVLNKDNHLAMARFQRAQLSELRECLRKHDIECTTAGIFDCVDPVYLDELRRIGFDISVTPEEMNASGGVGLSGIRRPVNWWIRHASKLVDVEGASMLRVTQDTAIRDTISLANCINDLLTSNAYGHFVAGGLATCNDISRFLQMMGMNTHANGYNYIQGNLMFAPYQTWNIHYLNMPEEVTHFCDDSVMSECVVQAGGQLIDWGQVCIHYHDADISTFFRLESSSIMRCYQYKS